MILTIFLPIAIRTIKPIYVMVITQMCYFFNQFGQKEISKDELGDLKHFMVETMGQIEQCFPPLVFDIMSHLIIHMVDQVN